MKTRQQEIANDFDLQLFRLISRAEQLKGMAVPANSKKWAAVVSNLWAARPHVRAMMSEEDRKATQ